MVCRLLLLSSLFLASGCLWPVRQNVNQVVRNLSSQPYDTAPESAAGSKEASQGDGAGLAPVPILESPTDASATNWMEAAPPDSANEQAHLAGGELSLAAWMASDAQPRNDVQRRKLDLNIPRALPGSEAPRVDLPEDKKQIEGEIDRIYPELPPLPVEPQVQPGPEGRAYTLSDLQSLAAANSPTLRQAVANADAARGNLVQAQTYSNPILTYLFDPANNNSTSNTQGVALEQVIRTAGKQKLGVAAAQKDLENAELSLKRARSDLATAVRSAYFTLLVDVETLAVTRALARFADDIYRLQTGLLHGALAAPYEPASLRAQAFSTRLAYRQAIADYVYDWKKLVATIGLRQLPLAEVAGRVDRLIPYFDYDEVLSYALLNHTDVLTAANVLQRAQYNLKLAQVTPIPDFDVRWSFERDKAVFPFGTYNQFGVAIPLAIWDRNKGNIIAAQAGLIFATEESHRVEVALTNNLAAAYASYQDNLYAIEYYRRYILPDLVRYYRGIYARRQVDPASPFGDLVQAQQTLSSNVTAYLGVLQNLWMAAVGVADFLQTDDFFQVAKARPLPEFPDLHQFRRWPCDHGTEASFCETHGAAFTGAVNSGEAGGIADAQNVPPQGAAGPPSGGPDPPRLPAVPEAGAERDGGGR
jgi:cobalt-zinc-cadmium efflux system outer membrane protein